jgi:hypothetical protein
MGSNFNLTSPTLMAHWQQIRNTATNSRRRQLSVLEVLEPRVLYSADSVASLLPLLLPDELDTVESLGASLVFDAHSVIDENDLLPEPIAEIDSVKHVVIIDSAVPESETIRKSAASESTTVIIVDAHENGVSVISQTLAQYSSLDSGWPFTLGNISVDTTIDKFDAVIQNTWDVGTLNISSIGQQWL